MSEIIDFERVSTALAMPEADGMPDLARHLAARTTFTMEEIRAALLANREGRPDLGPVPRRAVQ